MIKEIEAKDSDLNNLQEVIDDFEDDKKSLTEEIKELNGHIENIESEIETYKFLLPSSNIYPYKNRIGNTIRLIEI